MVEIERRILSLRGVVQGVGFRPFVYRVATELGLAGSVWNDASGVTVDVEGSPRALDELERRLWSEQPPQARVEACEVATVPSAGWAAFRIASSPAREPGMRTALPPDAATCDACLRELFDPSDRRFRYPFVNCTDCGPRFTIATDLPYDRSNTTMAGFQLCEACQSEYDDPADRRYHAQPLACPACGPHVELVGAGGDSLGRREVALRATQHLLDQGAIVAVKGIGGYHLMCDATNPEAVHELRVRKARGDKPLAVMVADLDGLASAGAPLRPGERAWLRSPARPIVLVRRTRVEAVSWVDHVAPGAADVGVMLPYSPLHHLLFDGLATRVLVCTSGNRADEPIAVDDAEARLRLAGLADAWLQHDRPIHTPCDDSVVVVRGGDVQPVRRSRGFVPLPVRVGAPRAVRPTLAMGGDLKGAVCLVADGQAWLSPHLGDLGDLLTYQAAERAVDQLLALTGIRPELVAVDAHPGYLSSRLGRAVAARLEVPVVEVQHHQAHVAGVLAEHLHSAPALGVAFDGTGYGLDGTIWGGEFFHVDGAGDGDGDGDGSGPGEMRRVAHLAAVPLPGGDAAIEYPARTALAHLHAAGVSWDPVLPPVGALTETDRAVVRRSLERRTLSVPTTSMGRLFDAVASLAGVCHTVSYEAQAAIELEAIAAPDEPGSYRFGEPRHDGAIPVAPVIASVVGDVVRGVPAPVVSMRFHRAVARLVADQARALARLTPLSTVALSGGVFQNSLVVEQSTELLKAAGFDVLTPRQVPTNDGGLAVGQAALAGRSAGRQAGRWRTGRP